MTKHNTNKCHSLPKPAHVLHTHSLIGNIDLFTGDQMFAFRGPQAPSTFPARILALLRDAASREATETHGLFEDGDGEQLQDDADAALAWITARAQSQADAAEPETRAILQELHDKFGQRVYGTSSYIKRDMRDRIAAVLAAPKQPSLSASEPVGPKDWTAINMFVAQYVEDYEMIGESDAGEACYTPNANERALILDAVHGLLAEPELIAALAAQPQADAAEPESGIELAARFVEKRLLDYDAEHGMTDPETGTREYPGDGDEYVSELQEIADGIRAIEAQAPGARGEQA